MFKNIGQKLVSNMPVEPANSVAEKAAQTVQAAKPVSDPKPIQPETQNTSIRAELQLTGIGLQAVLGKHVEPRISTAKLPLEQGKSETFNRIVNQYGASLKKLSELPLEKTGVPGHDQIDNKSFKPVPREIFTGSGDDKVDIHLEADNYVHVRVNGTEVWSGTQDQFKKLKIYTGDGRDVVDNTVEGATIFTGSGDDIVHNEASRAKIDTGDGSDYVNSRGSWNRIETGRGEDTVESVGEHNKIFTGSSKDTVTSVGDLNFIVTDDGADKVYSEGTQNVIGTGRGNDTIEIDGDDNHIYATDDNDKIHIAGDRNFLDAGFGTDSIAVEGNENKITDPDKSV